MFNNFIKLKMQLSETKYAPDASSSMNESQIMPSSARSSHWGASQNAGGGSFDPRFRPSKISQEIRVKMIVSSYLDSKFVTIFMSLVTVFALIGVSVTSAKNSLG